MVIPLFICRRPKNLYRAPPPDPPSETLTTSGVGKVMTIASGAGGWHLFIPKQVIAASFGLTTNTVLLANDLNEYSVIKPGQKLIILPVIGVQHTTKTGETIMSIAKKYQADEQRIIVFNKTDLTLSSVTFNPENCFATACSNFCFSI